jgi:hypothetical protein
MNLIARIAVIGCAGLFVGTTAAATVDFALPARTMLALVVAVAVWIALGRMPVQGGDHVREAPWKASGRETRQCAEQGEPGGAPEHPKQIAC